MENSGKVKEKLEKSLELLTNSRVRLIKNGMDSEEEFLHEIEMNICRAIDSINYVKPENPDINRKGVYIIIENGKVFYIGSCIQFYHRILAHYKENKEKRFDKIVFIEIDDKEERMNFEIELIKIYKPKRNKIHNPDYMRVYCESNPKKFEYKYKPLLHRSVNINYRVTTKSFYDFNLTPTEDVSDGVSVFDSFKEAKKVFVDAARLEKNKWNAIIKKGINLKNIDVDKSYFDKKQVR